MTDMYDYVRDKNAEIKRLRSALEEIVQTLGMGGDAADIVAAGIAMKALAKAEQARPREAKRQERNNQSDENRGT